MGEIVQLSREWSTPVLEEIFPAVDQIEELRKQAARERVRKHSRGYRRRLRAADPRGVLEKDRAWRTANPDRVRARRSAWHHNNPDKVRAMRLKAKYGMTTQEWDTMFAAQGSVCANSACRATEPGGGKNTWHTDHCHTTGKVRGILCHCCNLMLGLARDDADRLRGAIEYLKKHQRREAA